MKHLVLAVVLSLTGCASLSGAFGPPSGRPTAEKFPDSRGVPYPTTAQYFGHFPPGASPERGEDGEPARRLYLWVPNATPELGVRLVSPVAGWASRTADDPADPGFEALATSPTGFDPHLRLERCLNAMNPEDLQVPCEDWALLGENDDSAELPPRGERGPRDNALLRAISEPDERLGALIRGLYRVTLGAGKSGTPAGTWWLQVGAARELPPLRIAPTREALAEIVPP